VLPSTEKILQTLLTIAVCTFLPHLTRRNPAQGLSCAVTSNTMPYTDTTWIAREDKLRFQICSPVGHQTFPTTQGHLLKEAMAVLHSAHPQLEHDEELCVHADHN